VKTDVYSFGLVFWELLTQKDLFPEYNNLDLFTNDIAIKGVRPSVTGVDEILANIIKNCWAKDLKIRPTFKELIPILQNARVDINLPVTLCPTANAMWKEKFLANSKVPMTIFLKQLFLTLGKPDNVLHRVMVASLLFGKVLELKDLDSEGITTVKLAKLIKWFGPLKQGEVNILQRMEEVMRQKWFFGTIGADQSEKILLNMKEEIAFLVRLNVGGSIPIETSPFTISRKEKDTFLHTRVYPSKSGGYYVKIDGVTTKNQGQIGDFILSLQKSNSKICGAVASGHPFEAVFNVNRKKTNVYQAGGDEEEED